VSDNSLSRQSRLENGIENRISHFIKREGLSLYRKFKSQGYVLYFSEVEKICRQILEENVYSGVYIKPRDLKKEVYETILQTKKEAALLVKSKEDNQNCLQRNVQGDLFFGLSRKVWKRGRS